MAATEAARTTTRYTEPKALATRPFAWSPRYVRSFATMRMGR
jgi:hypothetical protein